MKYKITPLPSLKQKRFVSSFIGICHRRRSSEASAVKEAGDEVERIKVSMLYCIVL